MYDSQYWMIYVCFKNNRNIMHGELKTSHKNSTLLTETAQSFDIRY